MAIVDLVGGYCDGERGEYEIIDGMIAVFSNGYQEDDLFGSRLSSDLAATVFCHDGDPEGLRIGIDRTITSLRSVFSECEISYKIKDRVIDLVVKARGQGRSGTIPRITTTGRHETATLDHFRQYVWDVCKEIAGPPKPELMTDLARPELPDVD